MQNGVKEMGTLVYPRDPLWNFYLEDLFTVINQTKVQNVRLEPFHDRSRWY
jgi:hypothetical protein